MGDYRNKDGTFKKGVEHPYISNLDLGREWKKAHKMTDEQKRERGWYYKGKDKWYWKNCDYCDKEYHKAWSAQYCSKSCMRLDKPIVLRGDDNPAKRPEVREKIAKAHRGANSSNWKGGLTPLKKNIRDSWKYREWRSAVFERDNYTCQLCDERGCELNADHYPQAFAEILYGQSIQTMQEAFNCEVLWDTENGRTLCLACHLQTPNFGGRVVLPSQPKIPANV